MRFLNREKNKTDGLSRDQKKRVKEIEREIVDAVFSSGAVDRTELIKKYASQNEQGLEAIALDKLLGCKYKEGHHQAVMDEDGIIERQRDRKNGGRIMLCPRSDSEVEWKTTSPISFGARVNQKGEWVLED